MTFPTQEHIAAAQSAADKVKAATGFYCWPSVTLAQARIESASWTKLSGHNNGFGIKANSQQIMSGQYTTCRTREVINGKSVMVDAKFANFASLAAAYEAHAMLFVRVGVYKDALKAKNAEAFIDAIAPHYATDPTYARVIKSVCRDGGLYQYDKPAGSTEKPAQPKVSAAPPVAAPIPPKPPVGFWARLWAWANGGK